MKEGTGDVSPGFVLVVLDGLGDLPHPSLGGKTPLEAARTPHMDRLAGAGILGTLCPVRRGVAPESDSAVLGLLGYDPEKESPGRGVLEAMGLGQSIREGEVAFRFNFATANEEGIIVDQRVGRNLTTDEATSIAENLNRAHLLSREEIEVSFLASVGHRGVLTLRPRGGNLLSAEVSNSDPFYERVGRAGHAIRPIDPAPRKVRALSDSPLAERTARAVNALSERASEILERDPVNSSRHARGALLANRLLLRDAGTRPALLSSFRERHGLEGTAITEMPVERGIARLLGLEDVFVGQMGRDTPRGLRERALLTRAAILRRPFAYVHLKGPDEPGHDGEVQRKKEVIASLDEFFFGPFLRGLDLRKVRVAVTADHSTPCISKGHTDDPVPLLIAGGKDYRPWRMPRKFCERSARRGKLGERIGRDLLPLLLD